VVGKLGTVLCPATPLMSLITLANWIFIRVSAFCMR
jgi:hypothetical protein